MKRFPGLPDRVFILNTSYQVPVCEAISLIRDKRAKECYVDGEFLGIVLEHTGPAPASQNSSAKSGGMGFIKFVLPESSKQIQRNSLVRNVRTFAALV